MLAAVEIYGPLEMGCLECSSGGFKCAFVNSERDGEDTWCRLTSSEKRVEFLFYRNVRTVWLFIL